MTAIMTAQNPPEKLESAAPAIPLTGAESTANERPPDQGYAWVYLSAAFFVEALAFGYAFSVGILHDHWTTKMFPDPQDATVLALAATLQAGLLPVLMPFASPIYAKFPRYRFPIQLFGLSLCAAGIISSAFVTRPWQLVLSLGCAYGVGGALFYQIATALLFDWFDKKRGMASGLMYSASGIGGTVFPFVTQGLLDAYGYQTTLIASGIGFTLIGSVACTFVRPRAVHRQTFDSERRERGNLMAMAKTYKFWALCLSQLTFGLAMVVPGVYLPSFAASIGLSSELGTVLVAVLNFASAFGMAFFGFLSDRFPLYTTVPLSTVPAAAACLVLWGCTASLALGVVFAIVFGFFGLGYLVFAPRMVTVLGPANIHTASHLISLIFMISGAGNIAAGPIATALSKYVWHGEFAYGGEYGPMIVYTAVVILSSAAFCVSAFVF